ncbi:hypothetical protein NPIL_27301 [Nephila pilipes]|uniref:Uncharacterized protein n=1 Tax=Nephila pilipes TaxID=299642 RepID=A0A8X6TPQ6_NEPPI|nr:hypothetical protein NPIL_27301 [Nephila pilipes]
MVTKIAAFISVCEYNDGRKSQTDLMLALDMKINRYINVDKVRVFIAKKQATEASFEARKVKKIIVAQEMEHYMLTEGSTYDCGAC